MSNHLGDINKMVSDTPRTDEAYFRKSATMYDMAGEMKRMERELNAANSRIELLMSANAEVARIAGERDAAEKRVKRLEAVVNDPHALWTNWLRGDVKLPAGIGDVRQYQDRIKRLEEAGDGLMKSINCGCPYGPSVFNCQTCTNSWDAWRKAKEAKP